MRSLVKPGINRAYDLKNLQWQICNAYGHRRNFKCFIRFKYTPIYALQKVCWRVPIVFSHLSSSSWVLNHHRQLALWFAGFLFNELWPYYSRTERNSVVSPTKTVNSSTITELPYVHNIVETFASWIASYNLLQFGIFHAFTDTQTDERIGPRESEELGMIILYYLNWNIYADYYTTYCIT